MARRLSTEERKEKLKNIKMELGLAVVCCTRPSCRSERLSSWKITGKTKKAQPSKTYEFRCLDCQRTFSDKTLKHIPGQVQMFRG